MTYVNLRVVFSPIHARRSLFAVAMISLLAMSSKAACAPLNAGEIALIDKVVAAALAESGAPSASVSVVRDGKIAFSKAYGLRQVAPQETASVDTRYRIASVSKQFTAVAVLMLADSGKLSLDDEVSRYLPELGGDDHATVRQTLSHTAGYREFWTVDYLASEIKRATSTKAIVERWGAAAHDFPPGTQFRYSNTGYVVLARLVERVSGQPLGAFLRDRVFAPLHMGSAEDVDGRSAGAADAVGYTRYAVGPPRLARLPAGGWTEGCGELAMTASDLARWDISLIDQSLMSKTAYAEQARETKLKDGTGTGYGFGVFLDSVRGHRRVRHNGILPGFWSENRIYPDDRSAVVVMVNGSYGGSPHAVIANGIENLLIPEQNSPTPAASPRDMARKLYDQIRTGSLDRSLLTDDASEYLSGQALSDYQESFAQLGEPLALVRVGSEQTGGVTANTWVAVWPKAKLVVTLRTKPDGKVEEFVAYPIG
ncbi:MAG: serine hydrolase [Phenylobacterium sp.]|nr:serine hydrolase [Phenylobacterium sp.]